ncbi:hypothetical protein [Gaoshiqia sediminis]|uniref:Uncharacterized protein n=1 Tax=Gaoshiqia sediminis TaxID=2986998 RepID=A0AA41YD58_9BACT|nr:hypothetical protein [Gaoshiqia sediminis]MCW0484523.1 hypothetical protein [Gaoshiqia sediminis]
MKLNKSEKYQNLKPSFMRQLTSLVFAIVLLLFSLEGSSQNQQSISSGQRAKEDFDFNWQFHKGDIAMKLVVRGGQGGITDINVPIIEKKDSVIDYTIFKSSSSFFPADWEEVNLPHDWCVEGTFVHDDDLGRQSGGNGYLPTGIGFSRIGIGKKKKETAYKYTKSRWMRWGSNKGGH